MCAAPGYTFNVGKWVDWAEESETALKVVLERLSRFSDDCSPSPNACTPSALPFWCDPLLASCELLPAELALEPSSSSFPSCRACAAFSASSCSFHTQESQRNHPKTVPILHHPTTDTGLMWRCTIPTKQQTKITTEQTVLNYHSRIGNQRPEIIWP